MGQESAERKSGDHSKKSSTDKGKGILMYQRKKSRKDAQNNIEAMEDFWCSKKNKGISIKEEAAAALPSQHQAPPPPAAAAAEPPKEPVWKAKVYPSVVIPPSNENREISLPKLEDISFIELLASGDDLEQRGSSQPSISFMDMLQNDHKLKGDQELLGKNNNAKVGDCNNLQCFVESGQMSTTLRLSNNYFMKMLMEEEGVDDEQLLMEVKQELMIREVDAYACLLRKQNLDFGKLIMTTKNCI